MGLAYKTIARPLLFLLEPGYAHEKAKEFGALVGRHPYLMQEISDFYHLEDMRLETSAFGIRLPNPLCLAAGFDKNGEMAEIVEALGFGGMEIGSVTAEENPGNSRPRLWRLPEDDALVNRMGLNSDGCERVYGLLKGNKYGIPIGLNIAKTNDPEIAGERAIEDYLKAYRRLLGVGDFIVLDISCPGACDGRTFEEPENLEGLLYQVREEERWLPLKEKKPIALKLSPDLDYGKVDEIMSVAEKFWISGYVISNASLEWGGLKTGQRRLDKIRKAGPSGISGKPVKGKSTDMIRHAYRKAKGKDIIGCGGIFSAEDAAEKILAGASAIEVYTGLVYEGPSLPKKIKKGLLRYMDSQGYDRISDMVGRGN